MSHRLLECFHEPSECPSNSGLSGLQTVISKTVFHTQNAQNLCLTTSHVFALESGPRALKDSIGQLGISLLPSPPLAPSWPRTGALSFALPREASMMGLENRANDLDAGFSLAPGSQL